MLVPLLVFFQGLLILHMLLQRHLLKVLPTTRNEKEAFVYYRDGMSAQAEGEYAEALQNYAQAMRLEVDPYDRSFIFYNIGLFRTKDPQDSPKHKLYLAK